MSSGDCERVAIGGDRAGECEGHCMQKQNPSFRRERERGSGGVGVWVPQRFAGVMTL